MHKIELEMQNEERRPAPADRDAAPARYFDLYDLAPMGCFTVSEKGLILKANLAAATLLGVARDALVKQTLTLFILKEDQAIYDLHCKQLFETHAPQACALRMLKKDGTAFLTHLKATVAQDAAGAPVCRVVITEITERKLAEAYREMGREVLQILNAPGDLRDSIQRVLAALKTQTGFDAVGIRLQDGDDFPYFAQAGFSKDFLLKENTLIERAADGGVCRDKDGNVSLECTCGLVITGKTDPAHPLFTRGGSYWTNDSRPLRDLPSDQDPRLNPRNQCIHHNYASVALVPIRNKDRIVGLIQLNDRRKGRFTIETVELLEGIAAHIEAALTRKRAEEALLFKTMLLEAQSETSIDGILAVDNEGHIILFNKRFVEIWQIPRQILDTQDDKKMLEYISKQLKDPAEFNHKVAYIYEHKYEKSRDEIKCTDGRCFDRYSSPLISADGKYHGRIRYFRDITERKRTEEAVRQSVAELRALAMHLQVVREEERTALSRELHDDLGQHLTALQIDLMWIDRRLLAAKPLDLAALHDKIVAMAPMVEHLTELTQTICASLRPGVLDDLGLMAAIEWQVEDTAKRTGLTYALSPPAGDIELDRDRALAFFRIFQEALTNVARHAQATHVEIRLHVAGREVELEIQDNGQGFAPDSISRSKAFGMLGMHERAGAFGGTVDVLSEPSKGTTVRVRMPTA